MIIIYILVGLVAGILSGLLGIGGGILIVPSLITIFKMQSITSPYLMQTATGTSLGAMIITTLMVTWSHHKQKSVRWEFVRFASPGMILGGFFGVVIGKYLPLSVLSMAFAFFALASGLKIVCETNNSPPILNKRPSYILFILALLIGSLSGALGVGGGILIIPLLIWYGLPMASVSGTSAACVLPMAIVGTVTAITIGWNVPHLPPHCIGFVNWPAALLIGSASLMGAPLGVYLVNVVPQIWTKLFFALLLIGIAVKMLVT